MGKGSHPRGKRRKPSPPRQIGAGNDNAPLVANDNRPSLLAMRNDPGVKETPGQRIFRQMLRRSLDEAPRSAPAYDPSRLTDDQIRRARRAQEQIATGEAKRVASGKAALTKLQGEVEQRVEAARRANDNAEITALETARGEAVSTAGKNEPPGRLRVVSRDAMEVMWRDKTITDLQYLGGLAFRKRYELLDPERGLSPPALDGARKSSHAEDQFDRARQMQEAMDDLLAFQREVQAGDPSMTTTAGSTLIDRIGRRMFVLREVAGKGASLRSITSASRERARLAVALSAALDVAVVHFKAGADENERRPIRVWHPPGD